ncbi:MAG: MoxR family ATPase [Pseudomonadota bacterium]
MQLDQLPRIVDTAQPIAGHTDIAHHWDSVSVYAVMAAVASERPLLVTGETGLGKSQLARAAAAVLDRAFLSVVIQPYTEAQTLLWSYDYTARLADAQQHDIQPDQAYLCPGPMWWALSPVSAGEAKNRHQYQPNWANVGDGTGASIAECGVVLLVDEIDKADASVANSLLESLGDRCIQVPHRDQPVRAESGCPHPLVVFTSNEDRELPAAFLRRCTHLHLQLPSEPLAYFVTVGSGRYPMLCDGVLEDAARQILDDRANCRQRPYTGLAEYLDLLHALHSLGREGASADQQRDWLTKLGRYFQNSPASDP